MLILSFSLSKVNNHNFLNLFDGVIKVKSSDGDISPVRICSTNGYNQNSNVPTVGDLLLSTPINTDITITVPTVAAAITTPALRPLETIQSFCPQTFSPFGEFYNGANLYDANENGNNAIYNGSYVNTFNSINNDFVFKPNVGFRGVACFSFYTNTFYQGVNSDTNVSQIKIQVGGSTSTTCGADPVVTPGTITGKIYKKTIAYGGYFYTGPQLYYNSDYNTTWNPLPPGTTITITELNNPVNSFVLIPNFDGTYSQNVPPGQYSVTVNVNSNYKVATSTDLGDPGNTGSNPTIVTIASGQIKSAGTDGIFLRKERTGLIYPDYNNNGFQDNGEAYSISNPIPSGVIVKLTCVFPALFTMVHYPVLEADGSYAQQIAPEYDNTCTTLVTAPTGYVVTQSTETGDGVGSNPTVQTYTNPPNSISQGKDGLYQIPTTGTIIGKIYPDLNNNGFQDTNEPDYSAPSPSPVNTIRITNTTTSAFFDTAVKL
jgi:hypothetical protein